MAVEVLIHAGLFFFVSSSVMMLATVRTQLCT